MYTKKLFRHPLTVYYYDLMPILVISAGIEKQNKPPRNLFSTDIKIFHFVYLKFTDNFSNFQVFFKPLNPSSL